MGSIVDLEEEGALFDDLAFGEGDFDDLAGDLRLHLHGFGSLGGADDGDFNRD